MAKNNVVIACDSACDLSKEIITKNNIHVIPLHISMGDTDILDNGSITSADIYDRYNKDKTLPKTAAFSIQTAIDVFEKYTSEGKEVVYISISSKLSSCYQNASIAAEDIDNVYIVDSKSISAGTSLVVAEACRLRDSGLNACEIAEKLNEFKDRISLTFVIDEIDFLRAGGRCSAVAAMAANIMKLHPCISSEDGMLKSHKKYRGKMDKVYYDYAEDVLKGEIDNSREAFIVTSGNIDTHHLMEIKHMVESKLGYEPGVDFPESIAIVDAGCTIASHCGPGTLGIIYVRK